MTQVHWSCVRNRFLGILCKAIANTKSVVLCQGYNIPYDSQKIHGISTSRYCIFPEIYYASKVPVYLSFDYILLLNFFTFLVCLLSVLLPSYLISKISPVNSIKFR